MATISTRLTSNGNLLVNGSFDEVTYNPTNPTIKNLFTYTQDLSNPIWLKTGSTVTANVAVAPDGTLTASKLVGNSGITSRKAVGQNITITGNVYYTYSVYLKAAEFQSTYIWFDILGTTPNPYQGAGSAVNLTLGIVTGSQTTISSIGNGWYRCQTSAAANATTTTRFQVSLGDPNGAGTPAGDGTSGLYIWGEQLELGNVATIYQPIDAANTLVSGSLFKQTLDTVYAAQFDEVTYNLSNGMQQRNDAVGTSYVTGEFDEFTGAPVVDANLELWLDAGQTISYSGTGTAWNDISGNNNNFTLTSLTYNPLGWISYTANVLNYAQSNTVISLASTAITVECWVKLSGHSNWNDLVSNNWINSGWNLFVGSTLWYFAIAQSGTQYVAQAAHGGTTEWTQVTGTYDGTNVRLYVNGVSVASPVTIAGATLDTGYFVRVGQQNDPNSYDISSVKVYNRALSADEVAQNFNALRRRYNI